MAGDWIKMKRGLRHDPKVIAIARELGGRRDFMSWWTDPQRMSCKEHVTEVVTFANVTRVTVCALLDVWASLNNSITCDGKAQFMSIQDIDDIAEIPGFGESMESVGWVLDNGEEGLEFPNFTENNAPSKSRAKPKSNAQRQKEYRDRKKAEAAAELEQIEALRNVTGEKRREEKSNYKEGTSPDSDFPTDSSPPPISRPSLEQATGAAPMIGVKTDMADRWWNAREASDWMKGTAGGGTTPVGRNWQADLKSYAANFADNDARRPGPTGHRAEKAAKEYPEPDLEIPILNPKPATTKQS